MHHEDGINEFLVTDDLPLDPGGQFFKLGVQGMGRQLEHAQRMSRKDVTVLVVDDEDDFREIFSHVVSRMGYMPLLAADGSEAIKIVQRGQTAAGTSTVDVAIIDFQLPRMNGLQLLATLKKIDPHLQALFITGYGTIPDAAEAAQVGVHDCIAKPLDLPHLERVLGRLVTARHMAIENTRLQDRLKQLDDDRNIIGHTPQMQAIFDRLPRLAVDDRPVVIKGEVGTGKALLARAIHNAGTRRDNPFITLDCLLIGEGQLEKKIFGESRIANRAPVGAHGLWHAAHSGTLFIRNANVLPPAVCERLQKEISSAMAVASPDHAAQPIPHLIFSLTEKSIPSSQPSVGQCAEVRYAHVHMPPLRERRDDIPLLVQHFLKMMNTKQRRIDRVAPHASRVMQNYSWPGNVRELKNTIKRALDVGHTRRLSLCDLPMYIIEATEKTISRSESLRSLHVIEKEAILETLRRVHGDKARAAEILKIDRSTLYRKLRRYGLR